MAIFAASDRGRIVDALNLAEELNRANSVLATLMANRERDDVTYSVDRVTDILSALDSIDELQQALDDPNAATGIKRLDIQNQSETEYFTSDQQVTPKRLKTKHINNIKNWLDPNGLLEAYSLSGRVVRTL